MARSTAPFFIRINALFSIIQHDLIVYYHIFYVGIEDIK
jgi:hypothetical protein